MNHNISDILYQNAKETIENYLNNKLTQLDEELKEQDLKKTAQLFKENNSIFAIFPSIDLEVLKDKESRPKTNNYHFPDVLNIGEIINKTDVVSSYLNTKHFTTTSSCYIPIGQSGVCILDNIRFKDRITEILEYIGIKLIASLPDGLSKVTIVDKAGSGQNFPRLSSLHEKFTDNKILTDDYQIEKEIEEIKTSMSAITQSISYSGFETIEEYNLNTDEVKQRYNFIFVNNFPTGFSKKSTENLMSLIESGHKAGIYVLMSFSHNPAFGFSQSFYGVPMSKLIKSMTTFEFSNRPHNYINEGILKENIELLKMPVKSEDEIKTLYNSKFKIKIPQTLQSTRAAIKILNNHIKDLDLRPIVELKKAYPDTKTFWSNSASRGLCIPFGKKGIQNVYLTLGVNQYNEDSPTHHALIGGSTGSGKTVLLNDVILMGSMLYPPEELQFFLLDYKEGTEFAIYKDFPHVNILAMESEIEFGHDVLKKAIDIIHERGKLFKQSGSENLYEHNKKVDKKNKLPSIVIIIDEFQVLFPKDQKISSKSNELINDILRRGRSFGIRLMLATQTLKGVDIDSQILSNIPIRIALRMETQDAGKILTEDNLQGKHLSNAMPGEGIYNPSFGDPTANTHFQAFKAIGPSITNAINIVKEKISESYSEEEIEKLYKNRFVYNGEEEGSFEANTKKEKGHFYIGEPSGLNKTHISVLYERDFGENLLVIGDSKEKAFSIFTYIALQAIEQNKDVVFFNFLTRKHDDFKNAFKNKIDIIENIRSESKLESIYKIFQERKKKLTDNISLKDEKDILIFLFYIESSKLYSDHSYKNNNAKILSEIMKDGPELGIFLNYYSSDYQNIQEADIAKDVSKFKKRIALKGGSSLKLFGIDSEIKFSSSDKVSIILSPNTGEKPIKFKPYKYRSLP